MAERGVFYTCACCKRSFEGVSEEDAVEEYERYFGKFRRENVVKVCDECFQRMHPENHPHLVEEAMAHDVEVLTRDDDQEEHP